MENLALYTIYITSSFSETLTRIHSQFTSVSSKPLREFSVKESFFRPTIFVFEANKEHKENVQKAISCIAKNENAPIIIAAHQDLDRNQFKIPSSQNIYWLDFPLQSKELELTIDNVLLRLEKGLLEKKTALLTQAVNQSANSIVITDSQGNIEFINQNFAERSGYSKEEVIGQNIRLIKAEGQDPETFKQMWETLIDRQKWEGEFRNRKKNGDIFWEQAIITPFTDDDGKIVHYLAINNDITLKKNAQLELERSRVLLKQIINRVPQYIFVRDADGRYHLANSSFAEYCGKTPEQIIGKKESEINPNLDYVKEILEEDTMVIESGTHVLREEKFYDPRLKKDRYFQYSKAPFPLPESGMPAILSVWTDVTERKEIEEEVRRAKEKLLDAQKLAGFGNWSYDLETRTSMWSEQVYEQYGLFPDQVAPHGEKFYNLIHPDDKKTILKAIQKAREGGFSKYECRVVKPDKTITHIEATIKPIYKEGVITGFFGTSLDITSRKNFEDELVLARKEAIAASKAKSDFLSVMSHEIRTPLNAIIVMAEMLINEVENHSHKDNLEILNFSAKDLLRIVNDILDFSKIEAGKLDLESIDINLKEFTGKIIKTSQLKALEKKIQLDFEYDDNIPEYIKGDPLRLGQILKNLISNAIKFTEKGGVKLSVKLRGKDKDSCRLFFGIKDTGIGISQDKIDSLFEVFTQASSETSRKFGGTGLGLAIVKNLLVIHNSEIHVESEPGKGSLFYFEIDYPYHSLAKQQPEIIEEISETQSLKGYNIMLVEDNMMNIMVAKKIFKKWDCVINVAEDGYIALQKATRIDFDLIIMDLQMPGIDGFETTRKLRKMSEYYSKIPIIALTAAAPGEVGERVREAGMNEMVTKPFNSNQLYKTIKSYLKDKPINLSRTESYISAVDEPITNDNISIEILIKLKSYLNQPATAETFQFMENVSRQNSGIDQSDEMVEIIETINSIIRINRSYSNHKQLLVKEMITELKNALDIFKIKYGA
jgi:PAS domain S-box-containing protein